MKDYIKTTFYGLTILTITVLFIVGCIYLIPSKIGGPVCAAGIIILMSYIIGKAYRDFRNYKK